MPDKPTHYPTHQLRFVERKICRVISDEWGHVTTVKILQQLWETADADLEDEWRDVPVVTEP